MGTLANGEVVAPFANAAMRLLREDWKGKYGSKMLAEELFPILQTGIPNPDQNFQNFITINAGDTGSFAQLIDKFGNKLFEITAADGLKPVEPPGYPPPKLKPRIEWAAKTIAVGSALSGTELDAVATDPETGATIAGSYVYTPPSGTVMTPAGTRTLYVDFTPTNVVKYRRAKGSTVLTITGSPTGIAFIQIKYAVNSISASGAFPSDVTVGDLLVVGSSTYSNAFGLTVTVTDSQGSYTQIGSYESVTEPDLSNELRCGLWYRIATSTGPNTVTVTSSGGVVQFVATEYAGVTSAPLDGSASDSGVSGATADSGSVAVNFAGDLVVGYAFEIGGAGISGSGAGFTNRDPAFTFGDLYWEDKIASVNTNANWTGTTVAIWVAMGASFKKA